MYNVPGYGPNGVNCLVRIEGRNLATYRQDQGMGAPTDELEGRHRVPDALVEDETVDELPDETREDGEEELIRKIKKGHS